MGNAEPVRVLVCRVGMAAMVETMADELTAMQAMVGGFVAELPMVEDERGKLVLYCNEEAQPRGLDVNRAVLDGKGRSQLMLGDFYFGRVGGDGEALSLTEDDVIRCRAMLVVTQLQ